MPMKIVRYDLSMVLNVWHESYASVFVRTILIWLCIQYCHRCLVLTDSDEYQHRHKHIRNMGIVRGVTTISMVSYWLPSVLGLKQTSVETIDYDRSDDKLCTNMIIYLCVQVICQLAQSNCRSNTSSSFFIHLTIFFPFSTNEHRHIECSSR
jgi:hypothetical protein